MLRRKLEAPQMLVSAKAVSGVVGSLVAYQAACLLLLNSACSQRRATVSPQAIMVLVTGLVGRDASRTNLRLLQEPFFFFFSADTACSLRLIEGSRASLQNIIHEIPVTGRNLEPVS
jgi:hypothetical protein